MKYLNGNHIFQANLLTFIVNQGFSLDVNPKRGKISKHFDLICQLLWRSGALCSERLSDLWFKLFA